MNFENGSAIIIYDPAKITVEKIIKVIEATGNCSKRKRLKQKKSVVLPTNF